MLAPSLDIKSAKEWARSEYATFGNMQFTILVIIAEGDHVALHWQVVATHQGDYLGVAATGKQVTYQGIALLRIADGKIVEDIAYWDNLSILQQLGATHRQGRASVRQTTSPLGHVNACVGSTSWREEKPEPRLTTCCTRLCFAALRKAGERER